MARSAHYRNAFKRQWCKDLVASVLRMTQIKIESKQDSSKINPPRESGWTIYTDPHPNLKCNQFFIE